MSAQAGTVWRPLSAIENLFSQLHDDFHAIGSVTFFAEFSGRIAPGDWEQLVPELMSGCPEGRAAIQSDDRGRRTFLFPEERRHFVEVVTVTDQDDVSGRMTEWVREPFPQGVGPLIRWRLLLPAAGDWCQLVVTAHHSAFDATAILLLIRRLLEALDRPEVLRKSWSEAALPSASWSTLGRYLQMAGRYVREHRPLRKQATTIPRAHQGSGRCVIHRWSPEETRRLMMACRAAGTTFTAVLGVTGALALSEKRPDLGSVFELTVPIDVRRYLSPQAGANRLGALIFNRDYGVRVADARSIAEQARSIGRELREFVESQAPLRMLSLAPYFLPKRIKQLPNPTALSANSLGRVMIPPTVKGLTITAAGWFSGGAEAIAVFSQAAITINDALTLTYYSARLQPEDVQALAEASRSQLLAFSQATSDDPSPSP